MAHRRLVTLILGVGVVVLLILVVLVSKTPPTLQAAQSTPCNNNPKVGGVVDTRGMPPVNNLDPCTNRLTMLDNALKHTGGPYISRSQVETSATTNIKATKVRSYFVTYGEYQKLMDQHTDSFQVYPDREVWLVVVQAPDQGPRPSLMPGTTPWPRRYYWMVFDATTGQGLEWGGNLANSGDWPASLPTN